MRDKKDKIFSLQSLINSSVTAELIFWLLIISAIMPSKTIYTLRFLYGFHSLIFLWTCYISFEYSIKFLGSLQCFKPTFSRFLIKNWYFASNDFFAYGYISSISGWWLIKFSNSFFLIRILFYYYFVCMIRNIWSIWVMFYSFSLV